MLKIYYLAYTVKAILNHWRSEIGGVMKRSITVHCLRSDRKSLKRFNNGHLLLWKTIFYLNDRDNFEYSWHDAFTRVDFPVFVVWGDDDAVAPAIIGSSISEIIKG